MKILVIGSAGMIGRKLLSHLKQQPVVDGRQVTSITCFDAAPTDNPPVSEEFQTVQGDLSDPKTCQRLIEEKPDLVFHLAAIVSGEAEENFAKGYRTNLDGTRFLFDAICAAADYCPRVVFTSSIAVFGAPFPPEIGDEFHRTPLTSYGTQKAICELLLADFTRRGMMDGIGIRLPTICVRPGKPNKAASGFFSNIIREPLAGKSAILPVSDDVRHWHASPRSAVGFLMHAAAIPGELVGTRRNLTMPGVSATVGEQLEALENVAGAKAVSRVKRVPDEAIMRMVDGWPRRFDASCALTLGFKAEESFEEIIRVHIEDECGGIVR